MSSHRGTSRRVSRRPRILAIGDVHGCARALARLIEDVSPQQGDLLVALGDYIDRGPDSYSVIEQLRALSLRTRLVPILGNHEQMMLEARGAADDEPSEWMEHGGRTTLASYSVLGDSGKLVDVPDDH